MTPRRRAIAIKLAAEWPMRCFSCSTGRMRPQWTDIHIYDQDVRGTALKCDRCGEIGLAQRMADSACTKALAREAV